MSKVTKIFVHGDPQISHNRQEERNKIKVERISQEAKKGDITLICGDLTQNGAGNVNNPFYLYFKICHCFRSSDVPSKNELQVFIDDCMKPLEKVCGEGNVLACVGNHDSHREYWFSDMNVVYDYVDKRFGKGAHQTYKREYDNICIYSLGIYPNSKQTSWFEKELENSDKPFVVFWHYNLEGSYSDFWPDKDKENIYKVLDKHRDRCLFICEGHVHSTYISEWRGFRVANGAGNGAIQITLDQNDNGKMNVDSTIIE